MVPPKGAYNVAVMFDRCRVTSCSCTCGAGAKWCTHVVALCLFRIHNVRPSLFILVLPYAPSPPSLLHAWPQCEPLYLPSAHFSPAPAPKPFLRWSCFSSLLQASAVCLRAPVSESLSRLQRDQLQKFAQYLISELPQQVGEVGTSSHCWLSGFASVFLLGSASLDSPVPCSLCLSSFPLRYFLQLSVSWMNSFPPSQQPSTQYVELQVSGEKTSKLLVQSITY